ncbi:tyrosinase [Apiospora arundinis]|uniref:Di-copper centre-containing protein n=1 Tax=Apiospora arundinis TaxID=335852 RepID=A0ABR2J6Q7_9PEZI
MDIFLLLILALSAFGVSRVEAGYDYGRDIHLALQKRQSTQPAITTGAPRINGTIPYRKEIRKLGENHEQWTLYILALDWMQFTSQDDPYSWYRMTGIHAAPFVDYGGVQALPDGEKNGYCPHISNLFPTWHRPYLAYFEQVMYNVVQYIASLYPAGPQRARFQEAAQTFRMPYWDWAAMPPNNQSVLPFSVGGEPDIMADGPNGLQLIANPLFTYTFKPLDPSIFPDFPFFEWNNTKRAPTPPNSPDAISNNSDVARRLDAGLRQYQTRLYNLFVNNGNYSTWSNEAWITDPGNSSYDSIESLHDTIHLAAGGDSGHMAIIAYSAFDPIFFLHHANVDRIFAMWQVLHNDSWIEPMMAIQPTRTLSYGASQNASTDLTPFFVDDGQFWNSNMVRDHQVFNYTYAEVASKSRSDVISAINKLYTDFSAATMSIDHERRRYLRMGPNKRTTGVSWNKGMSNGPFANRIIKAGHYLEWIANIVVNKHAMNTSFKILLFLGNVPDDRSTWDLSPELAGSLGIFAGPMAGSEMRARKISGTVPLTSTLVDHVYDEKLRSLSSTDAEAYLRENLKLRVVVSNGTVVEPNQVDGLKISIVSSNVKAAKSNAELASWGRVTSHFDLYGP